MFDSFLAVAGAAVETARFATMRGFAPTPFGSSAICLSSVIVTGSRSSRSWTIMCSHI